MLYFDPTYIWCFCRYEWRWSMAGTFGLYHWEAKSEQCSPPGLTWFSWSDFKPSTCRWPTRRLWRRRLRGYLTTLLLGDRGFKSIPLNYVDCRNRILGWISTCSEAKYAKSGSMASRLRDQVCGPWPPFLYFVYLQGNEKFVAKDNIGALKLYTESVICAPEVGPELSLAFGNRCVF